MSTFLKPFLVVFNPFGTNGNARAITGLGHIDRLAVNQLAIIKLHQRAVIANFLDHAFQRVVFADELRHKAVFRRFIKLIRRCKLLDAPIVKHSNPIRHRERFGLVVGHVNNGDSKIVGNSLDFELHMFAQLFVERAKWFVHQDQFCFEHKRTRQCDALLLPA